MAPVRHWRRPLKEGGVEFFFDTGTDDSAGAKGSCSDEGMVDFVIQAVAAKAGVEVPSPEMKPMRGAASPEQEANDD